MRRLTAGTLTFSLILKLSLSVTLIAFAASSIVTTSSYQSVIGGELNAVGVLSAADRGFVKAGSAISSNGADCSNKILFGASPTTATPGITSGDMVYDVQLNTTGSTPANGCWQVKLVYTTGAGALTTVGPAWIGTGGSTPPTNQVIDCKFDVGIFLPTSTFSYALSVTT